MTEQPPYPSKRRGNLIAEWENIGEGWCEDYDPTDPDDENLLRFSVYYADTGEQMEDASYCTQMPADTDPALLTVALDLILTAAESDSPKRALEMLSWINPISVVAP